MHISNETGSDGLKDITRQINDIMISACCNTIYIPLVLVVGHRFYDTAMEQNQHIQTAKFNLHPEGSTVNLSELLETTASDGWLVNPPAEKSASTTYLQCLEDFPLGKVNFPGGDGTLLVAVRTQFQLM